MSSYYATAQQTNGSEEEDYYFLQPMFEKLPPNEILSQRYAPDVATQVKLMYLTLHAVPKINVKITWILYHQRQKMQKCKIMHRCSMFSIISAPPMLLLSTRQSTSNSITPSITSCLMRNWRQECFPLSMYPSSNFTVSNRLIFLRILDLIFHKMDRTVIFPLQKIIEGVLLTLFFVRIFNLEIYLQQLE